MHLTNSFLETLRRKLLHPLRLAAMSAGIVMAVVSAPFNSGPAFGVPALIGFWTFCIAFGVALAVLIETLAEHGLPDIGLFPRRLMETLAFGLTQGLVVYLLVLATYPPQLAAPATYWLLFAVLGGIYGFIALAKSLAPAADAAAGEEEPAFLKRLPQSLGKSVNRVSSSDHYVEVSTDLGSEMILMRFSDAVNELDCMDGVQVHRSHWVSRDAVIGSETANGKTILVLKDGAKIPVSRSYRQRVEEAGFI